jgi:hypothetical protein
MQRALAVAGLVLVAMSGVAYADSPGGWSQFDAMVATAQGQNKVAPLRQVQQNPVYEFPTGANNRTRLFPPNQNEGANN